jgi:hypothetical protein
MKKILPLSFMLLLAVACTENNPAGGAGAGNVPYLAKVNGEPITVQTVREEFNMLPPEVQEMFRSEGGMEDLVEELIKKEVLYLESKKKGVQNSEEFRKRLNSFKKRLMVEVLLADEINDKALISDSEVRDFYEQNTESFIRETPEGDKTEAMKLESVEGIIRQYLTAEKQKEIFDSYIASLRKNYRIEYDRESIGQAFGNTPQP